MFIDLDIWHWNNKLQQVDRLYLLPTITTPSDSQQHLMIFTGFQTCPSWWYLMTFTSIQTWSSKHSVMLFLAFRYALLWWLLQTLKHVLLNIQTCFSVWKLWITLTFSHFLPYSWNPCARDCVYTCVALS